MKKWKLILGMILGGFSFLSCEHEDFSIEEVVIVANRGAGSISFIDASTNSVTDEISIPGAEPMYVVYVAATDRIYVGDRAQDQIHVINPDSKVVETSIHVGNGVFHMWADPYGDQLWVNNDIDKTTSIIDLSSNTVIATLALAAKPHDVFTNGTNAYISVFSESDAPDSVYIYSTYSCEKLGAVPVGKDPHLFHVNDSDRLFVPCQSGQIYVLDGSDLSELAVVSLEGVHGLFHAPSNDIVYLTNISGAELYAVNDDDGSLIGSPVTSPVAVPHNITVDYMGAKMFVTHSGGTADKVTSYTLGESGSITLDATITTGTNPFGLAYYARFAAE